MKGFKIETNFKRKLFGSVGQVTLNKSNQNIERELINVYPGIEYQEVIGVGGAITQSSAYCLTEVNKLFADNILDDYFLENGLNYQICRVPIGSCDFALNSYSYSYKEDLSDFSIEEDMKQLIPIIKKALSRNSNLKVLATAWSPPAFMKSNKSLLNGGKLLNNYYRLYAEYLTKYILEYQKCGIQIHYITIQNEPNAVQKWESCIFSAEDEAEFAMNYLYKCFRENGINTKILAWDHNKEKLYKRSEKVFENSKNVVDGMAMHWYSGDYFEEISIVRAKYPEKLLFHTEGCTGFSNFRWKDEVMNAEIYGHDILGDFNAGINAFIDWNIVLDNRGGPNHKNNYCNAPIMLKNNGYVKNLTYYYIGHFSKYIRPHAKRIAFSKYTSDIEVTSFKNIDGSIVVVLLNRNDFNKEYTLNIDGYMLHDNLDSHAIVSFVLK